MVPVLDIFSDWLAYHVAKALAYGIVTNVSLRVLFGPAAARSQTMLRGVFGAKKVPLTKKSIDYQGFDIVIT